MVEESKFLSIFRKFIGRSLTYGILLTSLAQVAARAGSELHNKIRESQQESKHAALADQAASEILYRVASPLPKDPKEDFEEIQAKFLDLSDPAQRKFLELAKSDTRKEVLYFVLTRLNITEGTTYDLKAQRKTVLFRERSDKAFENHVIPSAADISDLSAFRGNQGVSAIRRHPRKNFILGCLFNNIFPNTMKQIVPDASDELKVQIVDSAIDRYFGIRQDGIKQEGIPSFTQIEFSVPALTDELYLHIKDGNYIIWTGPFGTNITLEKDRKQPETTIENPKRVSVLALDRSSGISYNPHHLSIDDVLQIQRGLPRNSDPDIFVVDRASSNFSPYCEVEYYDKTIGIISAPYWEKLIENDNVYEVNVTKFRMHKRLEDIVMNNTMIELPKGTNVLYDGDRIGIRVDRPDKIPVAKYIGEVIWISTDSKELKRLVFGNYCLPAGSLGLSIKIGGPEEIYREIPVENKKGHPEPFIMVTPDENFIVMNFGVNWEDPWIKAMEEMERRGAYMMEYDPKKDEFKYYHDGSLPPSTRVKTTRPRYDDQPSLVEK